jgi:hypothetical protein
VALADAAPAQESPQVVSFQGSELFCHFLKLFQLRPVHKMADIQLLDPKEAVVIVFGQLGCLDSFSAFWPGGLKKYVDDGGAVLVASDRSDKGELREFHLEISGRPVQCPMASSNPNDVSKKWVLKYAKASTRRIRDDGMLGETHTAPASGMGPAAKLDESITLLVPPESWAREKATLYEGHPECVLVQAHIKVKHPLFERCTYGIATNAPSYILRKPGNEGMAWCRFPPVPAPIGTSQFVQLDWWRFFEWEPAFAAWSKDNHTGAGRMLFVSGHGVFMNGMLAQEKTDNIQFAINALRWLSNDKQRKSALFIEENELVTNFDVPLLPLPLPTVAMINSAIRGLEKKNAFNLAILDLIPTQDLSPRQTLIRYLVGVGIAALAVLGLWRFHKSQAYQDPAVPLVEANVALAVANHQPPIARRQRANLEANNYFEAAQTVARDCLDTTEANLHTQGPPRAVAAKQADARRWQRAVSALWDLAHAEAPERPLSAKAFAAVVKSAAEIKKALQSGALQLEPTGA